RRHTSSTRDWSSDVCSSDLVELVVPPKAVSAVTGRALERAVVTAVCGILAPGEGGMNAAGWQQRGRMRVAIGPPPQADEPESPADRKSVVKGTGGDRGSVRG